MKINPKSQKGAITLIVLVTMLFLIAFLMSMYIRIANKAQTSAETTEEIAKKYNNIGEANDIYNSYFANSDVIPIYTRTQLEKIGSGEKIDINGKIYTLTSNGYYTLMNDLDLGGYDEENDIWVEENAWNPITNDFTGTLDGLGHTINGLYLGEEEETKGLFETLKGTVKNLNIMNSYVVSNKYYLIAGTNNGTITKCSLNTIKNNYLIYGNTQNLLPEGYQQVEYIESTGTQCIDTGVTCNENLKIEVRYAISSFDVNRSYIFGCYGLNGSYRVQYSHANIIFAGFGNMYNNNIASPKEEKQYELVMDNGKFTLDGEEIYDATSAGGKYSSTNVATIYLFACNSNGTIGTFGSNKIYECKMYVGENLVRNFVPCYRKSDSVKGLYDKVNDVFYTNDGTGEFQMGDEIPHGSMGNANQSGIYTIPMTITTLNGNVDVTIILDEPLRKLGDIADYIDLKNKKVVRYIEEAEGTGELSLKNTPVEENIVINNLPDIRDIVAITVKTSVQPSNIELINY